MDELPVTVPRRPGRLRVAGGRDELDEVLDDVLGPAPEGGAGLTDALLVAAGAGLLAAGPLWDAPPAIAVAGAVLLLLGLALPARALLRRRHRPERAVLVVADPHVGRLVTAHDRVVALVGTAPSDLAAEALSTAHLAVVEVSSLLQGRRPAGPAERDYCDARSTALDALAAVLSRRPVAEDVRRRELVAGALRDLEDATGQSSPARLEELRRALDEPA